MRIEFSEKTKKTLAERVAWHCSFPGCGKITIGPGHTNEEAVIKIGEAAHIYAASRNGPRPNSDMSPEQLCSIDNGIWLCRIHARLIDADESEYSAETLKKWKTYAEQEAYRQLENSPYYQDFSTLIGVADQIFLGRWLSSINEIWTFEVNRFIKGSIQQLRSVCDDFDSLPHWQKFAIIESQGDGRPLESISWKLADNNKHIFNCQVLKRYPRITPVQLGSDLALDDDGDLKFENGDIHLVHGIDSALQTLKIFLESLFGDYINNPLLGSFFNAYFWQYRKDIPTLNRMIKMEIIRLLTTSLEFDKEAGKTSVLNFINRIFDVEIAEKDISGSIVPIKIHLEWGDYQEWRGILKIRLRNQFRITN